MAKPPEPSASSACRSNVAPVVVRSDCEILGFSITGWDEVNGAIEHSGGAGSFIGTHAEIRAYLQAWSACAAIKDRKTGLLRTILPMGMKAPMAPGSVAEITSRPQRSAFRGDRIAVPMEIAPWFRIEDVLVGNRSQLPQAGGMSAEIFSMRIDKRALLAMREHANVFTLGIEEAAESEFGRELVMETAQTAMDVVLVVALSEDAPESMAFDGYILGQATSY